MKTLRDKLIEQILPPDHHVTQPLAPGVLFLWYSGALAAVDLLQESARENYLPTEQLRAEIAIVLAALKAEFGPGQPPWPFERRQAGQSTLPGPGRDG